jgi:hypothetical protein
LRLILRRCRDVEVGGEVRQELLDVGRAEFRRMAIAMKSNEAFDPVDVHFLGANAVVFDPDAGADLVEQPRNRIRHDAKAL